jgi:N-acyl-D-amino-acid deacylase
MRLGRAQLQDRFSGEVAYHDTRKRVGPCLYPPRLREPVPLPDGADNFEMYEAHGGWVASAVDLLRFARGFDTSVRSPVLSASSMGTLLARPDGPAGYEADGRPRGHYYACGWRVRPNGTGGRANVWHMGTVWGASAMLVRRGDGISWAALFNTDSTPSGTKLPDALDDRFHEAADRVNEWPEGERLDA